MFSKIWAIIETIKSIIGLVKQALIFIKESQKKSQERKGQERDEAIDDLEKSKTKEEFIENQKRIVDSEP